MRAGWWANWAEYDKIRGVGEVSEWLKEHAWKACKVARPSQVRILFSPPNKFGVSDASQGANRFRYFFVSRNSWGKAIFLS